MRRDGRDWMNVAKRAADIVGEVAHGEKNDRLAAASKSLGIPGKTLRSYLLARKFVGQLEPGVRAKAEAMPAAAVEVVARWHLRDEAAALDAIEQYHRGKTSVRGLLSAEFAARPQRSELGGRRLEIIYREEIDNRFGELLPVWPGRRQLRLKDEALPNPTGKADLVKALDSRQRGTGCAVVIVGPYSEREIYGRRAVDWCLKALGLKHFHQEVAIVLPPGAPRRRFIDMLNEAQNASGVVVLMDLGRRGRRGPRRRG